MVIISRERLSHLFLSLFILCMLMSPEVSFARGKSGIKAVTSDALAPLEKKNGYLLIDLELEGRPAFIEVVRLNKKNGFYLSDEERPKTLGKRFRVDLKGDDGFYFLQLSKGLYQVKEVSSPYFDLPYWRDTEYKREWRFSIEQGKTNYVGKLKIEKERSANYVDMRLINKFAYTLDRMNEELKTVFDVAPLRLGTGVRDDFFEFFEEKERQ